MKIDIIERNGYKVSQRLERILNEKLKKLEKYFDKEANAKVVCLKDGKQEKLEITITSKGVLYRSEVTSDNMYNNIDYALPKLEKQIVRNVEKRKEIKAKGSKQENFLPFEFLEEEPEELPAIYKRKTFDLDPMKINIIYRRKDGKFGLIDLVY